MCRASRSATGESSGPFWGILRHVQSLKHACGLYTPGNVLESIEAPYAPLMPRSFLLSFLVNLLLARLILCPRVAVMVRSCPWFFPTSVIKIQLYHTRIPKTLNKVKSEQSLRRELFKALSYQSSNDMSLGVRLWGSSTPFRPPPTSAGRLVFTAAMAGSLWFSRLPWNWGEGDWNEVN